jgi:thymidine kinase
MVEDMNKNVYVCGLDGDFKRKRFGDLLDLIPICDSVTKLHSRCDMCHNNAAFSHRLTNETLQVVIGSSNYVPLCRTCYKKTNNL